MLHAQRLTSRGNDHALHPEHQATKHATYFDDTTQTHLNSISAVLSVSKKMKHTQIYIARYKLL